MVVYYVILPQAAINRLACSVENRKRQTKNKTINPKSTPLRFRTSSVIKPLKPRKKQRKYIYYKMLHRD